MKQRFLPVLLFFILCTIPDFSCTTEMVNDFIMTFFPEEQESASLYKDYTSSGNLVPGRAAVKVYFTEDPHQRIKEIPSALRQAVKQDPNTSLQELVDFLVAGIEDPFLKVKVLHDWTIYAIRYDDAAYRSGRIPPQTIHSVIANGKGVCAGYALVFKVMCEMAGIPCQVINGYGRGVNYQSGQRDEQIAINHAWNAVFIKEGWYLMDVTWDSNYTWQSGDYSQTWFLSPPEAMIYSHLPQYAVWQLLTPVKTNSEFLTLAEFSPQFFMIMEGIPGRIPKRIKASAEGTITLPALSSEFDLNVSLYETAHFNDAMKNGKSVTALHNTVFIEKWSDKTIISVVFPKKMNYTLSFSWRKRTEDDLSGAYEGCGEIIFENVTAMDRRFPTQLMWGVGANLIEPRYAPLPYGRTQNFHFFMPGVDKLSYRIGSQYREIKPINNAGEFQFSVPIPEKKDTPETSFSILRQDHGKQNYYIVVLGYPLME